MKKFWMRFAALVWGLALLAAPAFSDSWSEPQLRPGKWASFSWVSGDTGDLSAIDASQCYGLSFATVVTSGSPTLTGYAMDTPSSSTASGSLLVTITATGRIGSDVTKVGPFYLKFNLAASGTVGRVMVRCAQYQSSSGTSGAGTLDGLTDVNMIGKADGSIPQWNAVAGKWVPGTRAASGVLDLDNDTVLESTAIGKIATTGDDITSRVVDEPAPDVVMIHLDRRWPGGTGWIYQTALSAEPSVLHHPLTNEIVLNPALTSASGASPTGAFQWRLGVDGCFTLEGATLDAFETKLCSVDPTADITLNLPTAAAGTYTLATLEKAQTWSGLQTFSSFPVFSSGVLPGTNGGGGAALPNCLGSENLSADGTTWFCDPDDIGTGVPAGANKYVQFNNAGVFGGSIYLQWDETTRTLSIGDLTHKGGLTINCDPAVDECFWDFNIDTAATTPAAGHRLLQARSTGFFDIDSAGANRAITTTFATGTLALGTSFIGSGACASAVTATHTGLATTDVIGWNFNADVSGVTGYAPATTGGLIVYAYPTANTVNFKVCNPTASSITPNAASVNYRVSR